MASLVPSVAPLTARRSSRRAGGSSGRRASNTVRAAARTEFASFFPEEVTALEEPAAVAMAKQCRHVSTPVPVRVGTFTLHAVRFCNQNTSDDSQRMVHVANHSDTPGVLPTLRPGPRRARDDLVRGRPRAARRRGRHPLRAAPRLRQQLPGGAGLSYKLY
jgi:hypothetical protein